jgi:hypothetical protein
VYGDVAGLQGSDPRRPGARTHPALGRRLRSLLHPGRRPPPRLNPILVRLAVAALTVLLLGTSTRSSKVLGSTLFISSSRR